MGLWTCPRCGAKLLTRNLSHSCGPYTIAKFLEGKSEKGRELFGCWRRCASRASTA